MRLWVGRLGFICFIALAVGCSGKAGARPAGVPVASATEQDLRNDLLRLHRDQEAFRIRHGTYAFALQDLDFRMTDGVSMTLRRVSAQSYYAVAGSGELECVIGSWGARTDLPTNIQASLIAPGTPSCTKG